MLGAIFFLLTLNVLFLVLAGDQFLETVRLPHFVHVYDGVASPNVYLSALTGRSFTPGGIRRGRPLFFDSNLTEICFVLAHNWFFVENGNILSHGFTLFINNWKGPFLFSTGIRRAEVPFVQLL